MPLPILRYPYHKPAYHDAQGLNNTPDPNVEPFISQIYDAQSLQALAFRSPPQPVSTNTQPDHPHVDAPNQVDISEIFNEGRAEQLRNGQRDIYLLHKNWRYVLQTTTMMALQILSVQRPRFRHKYLSFGSENPWLRNDGVTILDVWSFFSFLFDLVLESVSNKIISGEVTTKNAAQHAEQILLRLSSPVDSAPIVVFYHRICLSNIFNFLVGRRERVPPTAASCTFQSMQEIINDAGGRYVYLMVKRFIECANAAIFESLELASPTVVENYELCGLRFQPASVRASMSWSELQNLAFSPFINGLFLNETMAVESSKLQDHEFKVVALSRLRLYCCSATRGLTSHFCHFISYDTVAHGHWKQYNNLDLPAECFGLASTVLIFYLHAIRSGFRAGQVHPIVDPGFQMRDDKGNLTQAFHDIWRANVTSISELSVFTLARISALEQEGVASVNPFSATARSNNRSPHLSTLSPAQPSTLSRTKSVINLTLGLIKSSASPRAPDPTPLPAGLPGQSSPSSLSGSPSASPGLGPFRPSGTAPSAAAVPTSPGPGSPGGPGSASQSPILAALQEFAASCKLHERFWPQLQSGFNSEDERFPLLKGPVARKALRLGNLSIQDAASGNSGGPLRYAEQ